jgi:UDP-N-acetylmuramoyl-tripeptide--D-alanyl-D-alanine ligase
LINFKDILQINYSEIHNFGEIGKFSAKSVSTNTKTLQKDALFFAIRGENKDGHLFLNEAIDKGACAVVVDTVFFKSLRKKLSALDKLFPVPVIVVADTVKALGDLANIYRKKFNIPVIAVGGSNGKTTTKDMIAKVLGQKYNVLATEGNFNNQIGVPLTLFRLTKKHRIAVIEIGTNHFGEIEYLCKISEPTHGIITNIANEHLEFFNNFDGVKKEEGQLFKYLTDGNRNHTVFVNTDDKAVISLALNNKNKIKYGSDSTNLDVFVTNSKSDVSGKYTFEISTKKRDSKFSIALDVPGEHNMLNALAASAVGISFKVPARRIKKALESFKASSNRMEVKNVKGITILNDTYNANLDSMLSALETLKTMKSKGMKIIVLADMLELGTNSKAHHTIVGKTINKLVKEETQQVVLLTLGKMAKYIHLSAALDTSIYFKNKNLLIQKLINIVSKNDIVLVKGSRGMRMEEVVESIIKKVGN